MKEITSIIRKDAKNRTVPYARKGASVRFKDDNNLFGEEVAQLFTTPKGKSRRTRARQVAFACPAYDGDVDMDKPDSQVDKGRRRSERLKALQCSSPEYRKEEEPFGIQLPPTPMKNRKFRKVYNLEDDTQQNDANAELEAYKKRVTELNSILLIQTAELGESKNRIRQLVKAVESLEQQNLTLTSNLRSIKAKLNTAAGQRSPSPQSSESESAIVTPTDTPALPQRIIDEDYDEGIDLYHQRVARERISKNYGIDDSMDADETLEQITNNLSAQWKIDDVEDSRPRASGSTPLFSPIAVPSLFRR